MLILQHEEADKRMKQTRTILTGLFLVLLTVCCTDRHSETTQQKQDTVPLMVMQIRQCSRLYTTECHVRKIITSDDQLQWQGSVMSHSFKINVPGGQRKIAIPIDATVKAYIDFNDFSKRNIRRQGQKIEIILPDPKIELTATRIDHEEVQEYVGLTRSKFSDAERAKLEQQGRQAILSDLPRLNLTNQARENAARILVPMLEEMGFKDEDITITFRKDFNASDLIRLVEG